MVGNSYIVIDDLYKLFKELKISMTKALVSKWLKKSTIFIK